MKNQLINRLNPITICGSAALVAMSAIAMTPKIADAAVTTFGCASQSQCTLLELLDGGAILVDDTFFVEFIPFGPGFDDDVDPSAIEVIGLDDQPLNPGLKYNFNGQISGSGACGADDCEDVDKNGVGFAFITAHVDDNLDPSDPIIKDNSIRFPEDGFTVSGDTAAIIGFELLDAPGFSDLLSKGVCAVDDPATSSQFTGCQEFIAEATTNGDPNNLIQENQLFDELEFQPQSVVSASNTISGNRDDENDSFEVAMFEQRFSQVPEPLTMFGAATAAGFGAFFTRKVGKKGKK